MRNITTCLTIHEMYELVRDDPRIMEIDRAIEDVQREGDFALEWMGAKLDGGERLGALKAKRDDTIRSIFRARLNRLDKEQLISLVMTGEFQIQVRGVDEFAAETGIDRTPKHEFGTFVSRTDALLEPVFSGTQQEEKPHKAKNRHGKVKRRHEHKVDVPTGDKPSTESQITESDVQPKQKRRQKRERNKKKVPDVDNVAVE